MRLSVAIDHICSNNNDDDRQNKNREFISFCRFLLSSVFLFVFFFFFLGQNKVSEMIKLCPLFFFLSLQSCTFTFHALSLCVSIIVDYICVSFTWNFFFVITRMFFFPLMMHCIENFLPVPSIFLYVRDVNVYCFHFFFSLCVIYALI
jgi:hypothetical protein